MDYFPLFFDLRKKRVLLVGGGEVAWRKATLLTRAKATLRVVAPHIMPELAQCVIANGGQMHEREYQKKDMEHCQLVVSATDNHTLNARVAADATFYDIPVNVVDTPALCDFIFPAIIDRSPLVAAVSSSGVSPVLARQWRSKIESLMPTESGRLADFCERFRQPVKDALPAATRRRFWEAALDGAEATAVLAGDDTTAEALLWQRLQAFSEDDELMTGEVYLIGAGCGEAELLTFQALRLLQRADVVVHDRLVAKSVLELARRDAEKIHVGKCRDYHLASQDDINALLISLARQGLRVARLKGGDPFIFGRGGEEQAALLTAGIRVQVASGITAATGVAAAAGIPLTHRHISRGVRFCTAHKEDLNSPDYWQKLAADTESTLVFYMAGASLAAVTDKLINAGRCQTTAAAVICAGGTLAQQVITGTLATLAANANNRLYSPALIIVGEVVRLRQTTETDAPLTTDFPFSDIHQATPHALLTSTASR